MSKQFDSFIDACAKAVAPEKAALSPEFLAAAKTVGEKVESWGCEHGLMQQKSLPRGGKFFAATENFEIDKIEEGLGPQAVADLLAECNIPACYTEAAARKVGAILCQVLGKDGQIAFTDYNSNDPELKGEITSLESLYGADTWAAVAPAQEAFGINMDRVTPDLKTILTVALLQFHLSLTPRMVPIQSVTQSNIQITREMMDVFDMSKPEQKPTRVIELYRDPDMVAVKAIRIEPRHANDADRKFVLFDKDELQHGLPEHPVAYVSAGPHGIYNFCEDLQLFDLALDANKPGYDTWNHTDIIEEGIVVDGVLVEITQAPAVEGGEAKTEQFLLKLPRQKSRLTQVPNDYRSTIRRLTLDRTTVALRKDSPVFGSTADSVILGGADPDLSVESGKFLAIRLNLTAQVDRKTGKADASAWAKLSLRTVDDAGYQPEADSAEAKWLDGLSIKCLGFQLDARYNEDNKRKTSIRAEINRRNQSYELPSGRNFVIDFAIGQEGAVNAAARLAQLEHIGRDGCNLRIIRDTLESVHDMRMTLGNNADANAEIAATYAAGDMVNQISYTGKIDFSKGFLAWRTADAEGDIKQFVRLRLNKIITGILATSLMQYQLAEGTAVTFRMVTSPYILGAILSCHHIHPQLEALDQKGSGSVEYVMNLNCGAKLEIVTTTFMNMNNRILIIPFFESAPTSVLNFGTDYDQGTLVGAITLGADNSSAHNRMFSTTREALIPTNVIGACISVEGIGDPHIAMDFPGLVDDEEWPKPDTEA